MSAGQTVLDLIGASEIAVERLAAVAKRVSTHAALGGINWVDLDSLAKLNGEVTVFRIALTVIEQTQGTAEEQADAVAAAASRARVPPSQPLHGLRRRGRDMSAEEQARRAVGRVFDLRALAEANLGSVTARLAEDAAAGRGVRGADVVALGEIGGAVDAYAMATRVLERTDGDDEGRVAALAQVALTILTRWTPGADLMGEGQHAAWLRIYSLAVSFTA